MTRPTILDRDDVAVVPVEPTPEMASRGADAFFSPSPESVAQENARAASIFRRALSASPHSSAWQEVREYVAGLEQERDDMRLSSQHSADWANQAIDDMKVAEARAEAAEASTAELKALVDRLRNEAQIHAMEARCANSTIAEIYQTISGSTGEPGNWNGAEPVRAYVSAATSRTAALELRLAEAERVIDPFASVVDRAESAAAHFEHDHVAEVPDDRKHGYMGLTWGHLRAARAWKEGK